MKTRKQFIAAAVSASALMAAPARAKAPPAPPSPSPSPAAPAKISEAARGLAQRMRAFDPKLSDAELTTIAAGIEDQLGIGRAVNPKGRALKNSDEPATTFKVIA